MDRIKQVYLNYFLLILYMSDNQNKNSLPIIDHDAHFRSWRPNGLMNNQIKMKNLKCNGAGNEHQYRLFLQKNGANLIKLNSKNLYNGTLNEGVNNLPSTIPVNNNVLMPRSYVNKNKKL